MKQINLPIHPSITPQALHRLAIALEYWKEKGAVYVDLPWVADELFTNATRPPLATGKDVETPHGMLVASGEQSFCDLAHNQKLPDGNIYIGWTPCFRNEITYDRFHNYCFIKAESFSWVEGWTPTSKQNKSWEGLAKIQLSRIIKDSQELFDLLIIKAKQNIPFKTYIIEVEPSIKSDFIQYDIMFNNIELGSYGVRFHPTLGRPYIYATILAEPRFSMAIAK